MTVPQNLSLIKLQELRAHSEPRASLWEVESSFATLLHLSIHPLVHSKSPGRFPAVIGTVTQVYLPVHKVAPQHPEMEVTLNKGPRNSAWIGEQPPGVRCHTFQWCWAQKEKRHFCSCL